MDPALAFEVRELAKQKALNEALSRGDSDIQNFYRGTTLFVTGGTGFLGKQLIEKLLRSCDIKKLYILMRPKKNKSIQERLDVLLNEPVFDNLRNRKPKFAEYLVPIAGDITKLGVGISEEDRKTLTEQVNVIVHGAATVLFNEPIKVATITNVRGSLEMMQLGRECKNLKAYIHLSTAYSNTTKSRINKEVWEQFYKPPVPPDVLVEMVQTLDEKVLNDITPSLLGDWPNTYTFTKAVTEDAVRQLQGVMPICIVRPAIVICALREPSPGWMDISCAFGPSGLIIGIGLGFMHAVIGNPDAHMDLVPVDLVNNAVIAAGWDTAQRWERAHNDVNIYTVSTMRNSLSYGQVLENTEETRLLYPSNLAFWYIFHHHTNNRLKYWLLSVLLHYIPAFFVDTMCRLLGKPARMSKLYKKSDKLTNTLSYFTCNEWKSSDKNLQCLFNSLSPIDKTIFNFDTRVINWREYTTLWILGVRKYIVKDGLSGTEEAKKKQKRFRILHYIVSAIYFYVLYKLFCFAVSAVGMVVSNVF